MVEKDISEEGGGVEIWVCFREKWSKKVKGNYGVGLWESIMNGLCTFVLGVGFKVGDESCVSF